MPENDVELGPSLLVHRKSQVHLLTKTAAKVSGENTASLVELNPRNLWIPRARTFRLSLQFYLADDVAFTPIECREIDTPLAELIESAELWTQLEYNVSRLRWNQDIPHAVGRVLKLEFDIQSQRHFDTQLWCPPGILEWQLSSVQLCFYFTGARNQREASTKLNLVPQESHSFNSAADASRKSPPQNTLRPHSKGGRAQPAQRRSKTDERPNATRLAESVFFALVDAGLRSSICSKPIHLAPGIKCLSDLETHRLCDVAPAIFVPTHLQRLGERSKFIPGISKLLSDFSKLQRPAADHDLCHQRPPPGTESWSKDLEGIQAHLWNTVKNLMKDYTSARRLPPLRSTRTAETPDHVLEFPQIVEFEKICYNGTGELSGFGSGGNMDDQAMSDEALFEIDDQAVATAHDVKGSHGLSRHGACDCRFPRGVQDLAESYDFPFHGQDGMCAPRPRSRSASQSPSQASDVSMLLLCEEPMGDENKPAMLEAIGETKWLTHNVIRMHPLRHQGPPGRTVDQQKFDMQESSLYDTPGPNWWLDVDSVSDLPLECYQYPHPKESNHQTCFSFHSSSEGETTHEYLELGYDSAQEDFFDCGETPMSARQSRENSTGSDSTGSLSEVIGNDHLLWHMWKQRASVAPRGEEDVADMKTLFATDPDMKLFGSRRDLDRSDISASSNEDPMLDEPKYSQSPRGKTGSPMSPNAERRSYFALARSPSSSSGYVGRSSADPGRRSSLIKRFTWGGRHNLPQVPSAELSKLDERTIEVKRRKTLDDYETRDEEAANDDSNDMLF